MMLHFTFTLQLLERVNYNCQRTESDCIHKGQTTVVLSGQQWCVSNISKTATVSNKSLIHGSVNSQTTKHKRSAATIYFWY